MCNEVLWFDDHCVSFWHYHVGLYVGVYGFIGRFDEQFPFLAHCSIPSICLCRIYVLSLVQKRSKENERCTDQSFQSLHVEPGCQVCCLYPRSLDDVRPEFHGLHVWNLYEALDWDVKISKDRLRLNTTSSWRLWPWRILELLRYYPWLMWIVSWCNFLQIFVKCCLEIRKNASSWS